MTAFSIVAVGRLKGPLMELAAMYRKRLIWNLRVIEIEASDKAREAAAVRAKLPREAVLVALDETGRNIASAEFAGWIERQQIEAVPHIAFIIGGADGLDAALRQQAALTLAFGRITLPHLLARVILIEQIYRAQQIISGHPYHRA